MATKREKNKKRIICTNYCLLLFIPASSVTDDTHASSETTWS